MGQGKRGASRTKRLTPLVSLNRSRADVLYQKEAGTEAKPFVLVLREPLDALAALRINPCE